MPSTQPIASPVPKEVKQTEHKDVGLIEAINYEILELRKYIVHTESEPHLHADVFKGRETIKDLIKLLVSIQEKE